MSVKLSEGDKEYFNEYGWSLIKQRLFAEALSSKHLPDSSCLCDRVDPEDKNNNGLQARVDFSQQPLYQRFRTEETTLLEDLPPSFINKVKKSAYIVDYGCGDGQTTINILQNLLVQKRISAKNLLAKKYIVFDTNPLAVAKAKENFSQFLKHVAKQQDASPPQVYAELENRNSVPSHRHLLDQYPGDKCIFSTGFTIGNVAEENKSRFINFTNSYSNTLLTTYKVTPEEKDIPLLQATYGYNTLTNPPKHLENQINKSIQKAHHQLTYVLLAAGWTKQEIADTLVFKNQYTQKTGEFFIGFELLHPITKHVGGSTYTYAPGFYPIYQSQGFPEHVSPLNATQLYSKRGSFVGYDVYTLDYDDTKKILKWSGVIMATTIFFLLLTLQYSKNKINNDIQQEKKQAILELVNRNMMNNKSEQTDRVMSQSDSFKIELFYHRCEYVGNILNTIYGTDKFTGSQQFREPLENFLVETFNGYDKIPFFSPDRHVEMTNNYTIELAIQFIKKHPLVVSQIQTAKRTPLANMQSYKKALENTATLLKEKKLQQACLGKKVRVIGNFPCWGYTLWGIYTVGVVEYAGKQYIVSIPDGFLEKREANSVGGWAGPITYEKNEFMVGDDLGSFELNPYVARGIERILEALTKREE